MKKRVSWKMYHRQNQQKMMIIKLRSGKYIEKEGRIGKTLWALVLGIGWMVVYFQRDVMQQVMRCRLKVEDKKFTSDIEFEALAKRSDITYPSRKMDLELKRQRKTLFVYSQMFILIIDKLKIDLISKLI